MIQNVLFKNVNKIALTFKEEKVHSKAYIIERDSFWEKYKNIAERQGKKVWNGTLYSLENANQKDYSSGELTFSTMEYKDHIFNKLRGEKYVIDKFGADELRFTCEVGCILTTKDNKIVAGKKRNTIFLSGPAYETIGGMLSKDEKIVNDFSDIKRFALKEIQEETNASIDFDKIKFIQINKYSCSAIFLYSYKLDIDSTELDKIYKNDEYVSFLALSPNELLNFSNPKLLVLTYLTNHFEDIEQALFTNLKVKTLVEF